MLLKWPVFGQVLVPGKVTLQAEVQDDPLDPTSAGPLLEIELLVASEKVDVSLGTAVVNTTYYLEQARDDPSGQSPRFSLTVRISFPYLA
jgi:hypothetical protein